MSSAPDLSSGGSWDGCPPPGRETSVSGCPGRLSPGAQAGLCCPQHCCGFYKRSPGAKIPSVYLLLSTTTGPSDPKVVPGEGTGPKTHPAAGSPQMKSSGANFWCSRYPEGERQPDPESCSGDAEALRPACIKGESCFPFELIAKGPPVSI